MRAKHLSKDVQEEELASYVHVKGMLKKLHTDRGIGNRGLLIQMYSAIAEPIFGPPIFGLGAYDR